MPINNQRLGGMDYNVPLSLGTEVVARCGSCGSQWDTRITNPNTITGGVEIEDCKCPKCGGGYTAGHGISVRSKESSEWSNRMGPKLSALLLVRVEVQAGAYSDNKVEALADIEKEVVRAIKSSIPSCTVIARVVAS